MLLMVTVVMALVTMITIACRTVIPRCRVRMNTIYYGDDDDDDSEEYCAGTATDTVVFKRHHDNGDDDDGDDDDDDGGGGGDDSAKPLHVESLRREAAEVIKAAHIDTCRRTPKTLLGEFMKDDVRLSRREKPAISKAAGIIKTRILERLTQETRWKWDSLDSGSYYDGTKVTRADELDLMFLPKIPETWLEIECRDAPAEYCFLKLKKVTQKKETDPEYIELKRMCCDPKRPDLISSKMFRKTIHGALKKAVQDVQDVNKEMKVDVCDQTPGSPSFRVKLCAIPSSNDAGFKPVDVDLIPGMKLRRWPKNLKKVVEYDGFAVVPKQYKSEDFYKYKDVKRLLWRLSFPNVEKMLTKGGSACWTTVLRVLKRSLELMKGLENQRSDTRPAEAKLKLVIAATKLRADFDRKYPGFAKREFKFKTFQLRTLMWRQLLTTEASHWVDLQDRLSHSLIQLLEMLSAGQMRHFFVPELDIMVNVPREEREFLYIMFLVVVKLFCRKSPSSARAMIPEE